MVIISSQNKCLLRVHIMTENSNNSFKSDIRETEYILRIKKPIIHCRNLGVYV